MNQSSKIIGMVGVGNMGRQILEMLMPFVETALVYDTDDAARNRALLAGAVIASCPSELVDRADLVLTVLPRGEDVEQVALQDGGLLSGVSKSCLWLEMSTIDPDTTRKLGAKARAKGLAMADAAIVGRFGKFSFLFGGGNRDFERASLLLNIIGDTIWCGPCGSGVTAKIINNLLAGTTFVATCEALALGLRSGLSLELLLDVMGRTAANNAHLRGSIPQKVAIRDFKAGFSMALMQKDATLAQILAQRAGVNMELSESVYKLRELAIEGGMGLLDTTALAQVIEDAMNCTIM